MSKKSNLTSSLSAFGYSQLLIFNDEKKAEKYCSVKLRKSWWERIQERKIVCQRKFDKFLLVTIEVIYNWTRVERVFEFDLIEFVID